MNDWWMNDYDKRMIVKILTLFTNQKCIKYINKMYTGWLVWNLCTLIHSLGILLFLQYHYSVRNITISLRPTKPTS